MDRTRLLDMEERIRPVRAAAMGILAVALLIAAPTFGLWTLVPLIFAAVLFEIADRYLPKTERPEYVLFAAWAGSIVTIGAAVALTGGPISATLCWLALPVVTLSARFSLRGVYVGVGFALAMVLIVGFGADAQAVIDEPTLVVAPAALVLAIAALSTALMSSDLEHRGKAVMDPLTGMLNRKALDDRALEIAQQSEIRGDPVGMIVGDIDGFKEVNDSLGHAAGDAVLRDVAYVLRRQLRAFDLSYRIGGEEFLVLLPGADVPEATELAEKLRGAIDDATFVEDRRLTMSFGVAASECGSRFNRDTVFRDADASMYEAKRAGGNLVRAAGAPAPVPQAVG
jgi:diguanylate cyclase (GGDEF)-like protein